MELNARSIPFTPEVRLPVYYRQQRLTTSFRVDLICFEDVIVEIKALKEIRGAETAQTLNYLKASNLKKGLLLNFGGSRLEYKRFVWQ